MATYGLRVVTDGAGGVDIPVEGEFVVGRSEAGLGNLQGDPKISRRHARFYYTADGAMLVEDLQSTNGTFVNDHRINGPRLLRPGDRITLGSSTLQLTSADTAEDRTAIGARPFPPPPPAAPVAPVSPPPPMAPVGGFGPAGPGGPRAQPQMNEKLRARMQKGAAPLMEPDETVIYGVPNLTIPMWGYAAFMGLLLLPYVLQKASMAVATERNVYVIKTSGFAFKGRSVLLKAPLGSVQASLGGSAFPGRYLMIGDQKIWLHFNRRIQDRARAIAAAASSGPLAVQ